MVYSSRSMEKTKIMKPFFEDGDRVQIYKGDCLEIMPQLEGTFDTIICDLPYGITACKDWDQVIPFEPLWENYRRLIKPNGAIILFGSQPFTSALVMSNPKWFKYEWIWQKQYGSNFASTKYQPFKEHENVLVFSEKAHCFYPVRVQASESSLKRDPIGSRRIRKHNKLRDVKTEHSGIKRLDELLESDGLKHPGSVLKYNLSDRGYHPTQKPIDLLSYLIKTYTLPDNRILDNTAGSFSTGVAAVLNGRKFVGIEREEKYCAIGQQRIEKALQEVDSMLIKPWELDEKPIEQPQQMDLLEEPA